MRLSPVLLRHLAAVRALLVLTVLLGLLYPLGMVGLARLPGMSSKADGSLVRVDGRVVGSSLVGQSFANADGSPLPRYFQSRPSAAGKGYDPTSTSASNLGPEDVVDSPDRTSLLTQVCARSLAVGRLEGVSGARPYCTAGGVGAVLGVFRAGGLTGRVVRVVSLNETQGSPFVATYDGVRVELAVRGQDYSRAVVTPVRGSAAAAPAVPADAVTASASGLDPDISVAYARLQAPRVARERGIPLADVERLIAAHTTGRALGFMGDPAVDVLALNLALDGRG
jgi:K+-transporting ATPase ATPase C chain